MTHTRLRHPTPPTLDVLDVSWQESAACAGTDVSLWFAPDGREQDPGRVRRAKGYCAICEVRPECLAWAFEVDDWWAVLGGLTAEERRRARRNERRKVAAR